MNTQFVKLPDGSYINPAHVITIRQATHKANQTFIATIDDQFFYFDGDRRDEFAKLLSGDKSADVDMGLHTLAAYHSKAAEEKAGPVCQHECEGGTDVCSARSPEGFMCTRTKGHSGHHSACDVTGKEPRHDLHTWPQ
jgi:hypothetical protein